MFPLYGCRKGDSENVLFFFFHGTGTLTQDLHLKPLHQPFFVKGFFEIESCEVLAWADFKL
jgi:hypothetical protein